MNHLAIFSSLAALTQPIGNLINPPVLDRSSNISSDKISDKNSDKSSKKSAFKVANKACVGAITTLLLTLTSVPSAAKAPLVAGDSAPNFSVTTLDGRSLTLSDFAGKKSVYLKFWATWCSYCIAEMPHLQTVKDQYGQNIEVLSVNVGINDSVANIEKLFTDQGFNLPTTFDAQGDLTSAYGIVGTPHHVLIDRNGKIAYRTFLASDQLDNTIEFLANTDNTQQSAQHKKAEAQQ